MEQHFKNGFTDCWRDLKVPLDNLDDIISNERIIYRIINDQFNNKNKPTLSKGQPHLPSLLLYILLTGLHPLLSGFMDEKADIDEIDNELPPDGSMQTIKQQKLAIWNLGSRALSFSSREIHNLVYDICFNQSKYIIGHGKYEYTFKNNQMRNFNKRAKYDEITTTAHHQSEPNNIPTSLDLMKDKIITMQRFLASNYEFLIKSKEMKKTKEHITPGNGNRHEKNGQELDGTRKEGPGQNLDEWIHTIGYACLLSSNYQEKMNGDSCKKFFRIKLSTNDIQSILPKIIQPIAIHKPVTPLTGSQDIPISIELDRTGNLLAYGTESGTVTVVEVQSFKILCSFLGHNMPILSLCFLDDFA
ncbi:unnamed protein product, partial [Schistosoma curassoni]|uniref:WD_REPEATS_REGION domain-containing protein n=1 Tax=Schistosoma curassoni TaxID=6186 RepID=A0A183KYL7_9TREM